MSPQPARILTFSALGGILLAGVAGEPAIAKPEPHRSWLDWAKEVFTTPAHAVTDVLSEQVEDSFVKAAKYAATGLTNVLRECAQWFVAGSTLDLQRSGIGAVLTITVPLAALVAALMCIIGTGKAAWQADGRAFADVAVGLGKTVVIASSIVAITQTALAATDELSLWMVDTTLGSSETLQQRMGALVSVVAIANPVLALLAGIMGLALASILWWELMFRNVALLIVTAAAPIAAAGLVTQATSSWWVKTRNALLQLIVLKPVMTFCFLIGIAVLGDTQDLAGVFAGLLILAVAVIAWPLLASFLAFTDVGQGRSLVAGAMGLATGLGLGSSRKTSGPSTGPAASTGTDYTTALETENDATMATSMGSSSAAAGHTASTTGASAAAGAAAPIVLAVQKVADTAVGMVNTVHDGLASMAHHSGLSTSQNTVPRPQQPEQPTGHADGLPAATSTAPDQVPPPEAPARHTPPETVTIPAPAAQPAPETETSTPAPGKETD